MIKPKPCEHCGHAPSCRHNVETSYGGDGCGYDYTETCTCPCHDRADAIVAAVMEWADQFPQEIRRGYAQCVSQALDLTRSVCDALAAHPFPEHASISVAAKAVTLTPEATKQLLSMKHPAPGPEPAEE